MFREPAFVQLQRAICTSWARIGRFRILRVASRSQSARDVVGMLTQAFDDARTIILALSGTGVH